MLKRQRMNDSSNTDKVFNTDNISNVNQSACNNKLYNVNKLSDTSNINNKCYHGIISNTNNVSNVNKILCTPTKQLHCHSSKTIQTITKRSDFLYLKRHGKKIRANLLNIVYAKLSNNNTIENNNKIALTNNIIENINNKSLSTLGNKTNFATCNDKIECNNKTIYKYYNKLNNNTKIAYIASKKVVGNAVKRNRVKRRLRSLVREYSAIIPNNHLILIIASSKAYNIEYSLLKNDFLYCIKKIL